MSTESDILKSSHVIAVVGLSRDTTRPSCRVADYLKNNGYKVIPVYPKEKELMGEKCYPDLSSIPEQVDIVDIFRRSEDVIPLVEEAIKIKAKTIWMQEGIINKEAAEKAKRAGLEVIMDKCMRKELIKMHEEEKRR
jgi:predicted CoA-binding protein